MASSQYRERLLEPADVRRGTWQVLMVNRLCSGTSDSEEGAHIVRFYKIGQRRSMYAASSAGALLIWASDIPTAHEKGPGAMPALSSFGRPSTCG
jgi:hypothetical protein